MPDSHEEKELLQLSAMAAHQLKSPINSIQSLLRSLLGDFVGPLSDEQREVLSRADARCNQAIESIERMLAIAGAAEKAAQAGQSFDAAVLVRQSLQDYADAARDRDISLSSEIGLEPAWVKGHRESITEAVHALVENALKYTPDHGRVRISLAGGPDGETIELAVSDSGVGIPEEDRDKVFRPFYRSRRASGSSRKGSGLGLSLVKTVVEAGGGSIRAEASTFGGARMMMTLPAGDQPEGSTASESIEQQAPFRVVIVGGVAAGPKVASKIIRMRPSAEVTIVEKGKALAYAGCGLAYYVSGAVKEQRELLSTPLGAVRDPVFFQNVKNVRVMNQTEALEIDRDARRVKVRDTLSGDEDWLAYDKLVLATGATPVVPAIEGADLQNVFSLHGVHDAEGIKAMLAEGKARDVAIVGGGLIGVEATEALVARGCRVTIVEARGQILRMLDWEIARLVERHMESRGVRILTSVHVESFEGDQQGRLTGLRTDQGHMHAEMAIVGVGVRPAVTLAQKTGLDLGPTGAIRVDDHMRTSDPDIYAAGDCAEQTHQLTGNPCYVPLGSTANKQGRVAAINVCGGDDTFPGVMGSTVCRVFDYCVGRTGLTEAQARALRHDVVTVLAPAPDRAHYMPEAGMLLLKLVVDRDSRRLLGVQVAGPGAGDKRIDVAAVAIASGWTVDQLAGADLCYAPPYSPAMDNLITAANIARNKLAGAMEGISPMEVRRMLDDRQEFVFLDVRSPGEHEKQRLPGATLIPLGALRGRLDELPRDRPIVAFCQISLRGYEAALILRAHGFDNVRVLDGGVEMWPYETLR